MTNNVAANYAMPTILDSLKPAAAGATAKSSSTTSTGDAGATALGTTFLSLLVKELQNQDPTAPMDSTAMVGQMISLNQLDQLITIKQTLAGASTTATGAVQNTSSRSASPTQTASTAAAAANTLPFDPNTMMPTGTPSTASAANPFNSPLNVASMGFTGFSNTTAGGK